MPIIATDTPGQSPKHSGGMSWAQIKEQANKRTDRRGEKTLDLDYELLAVMQDFCSQHQWYWRKLKSTFTTEAGVAVYDLSDPESGNANDCEKIIAVSSPNCPRAGGKLAVVVDDDYVMRQTDNITQGQPDRFYIEPNAGASIHLVPTPDAVYSVDVLYWAVPSIAPDETPEDVPLVPSRYHHILVKGLECSILRYTLGEGAAKFMAAKGEYDRLVAKASENKHGVTGVVREYKSAEDGIRSTNSY